MSINQQEQPGVRIEEGTPEGIKLESTAKGMRATIRVNRQPGEGWDAVTRNAIEVARRLQAEYGELV